VDTHRAHLRSAWMNDESVNLINDRCRFRFARRLAVSVQIWAMKRQDDNDWQEMLLQRRDVQKQVPSDTANPTPRWIAGCCHLANLMHDHRAIASLFWKFHDNSSNRFFYRAMLCIARTVPFFSPSGSHTTLVFPHQTGWRYSRGNSPNRGINCRWGRQISRFWAWL